MISEKKKKLQVTTNQKYQFKIGPQTGALTDSAWSPTNRTRVGRSFPTEFRNLCSFLPPTVFLGLHLLMLEHQLAA